MSKYAVCLYVSSYKKRKEKRGYLFTIYHRMNSLLITILRTHFFKILTINTQSENDLE